MSFDVLFFDQGKGWELTSDSSPSIPETKEFALCRIFIKLLLNYPNLKFSIYFLIAMRMSFTVWFAVHIGL